MENWSKKDAEKDMVELQQQIHSFWQQHAAVASNTNFKTPACRLERSFQESTVDDDFVLLHWTLKYCINTRLAVTKRDAEWNDCRVLYRDLRYASYDRASATPCRRQSLYNTTLRMSTFLPCTLCYIPPSNSLTAADSSQLCFWSALLALVRSNPISQTRVMASSSLNSLA